MGDQYDDLERLGLGLANRTGAPIGPAWGQKPAHAVKGPATTIKAAQSQLIAHGFGGALGHAPNGQLTTGTRAATTAFQVRNGLKPTGVLDPPTQAKLHSPPQPSTMGPSNPSLMQGGLISVPSKSGGPKKPGGGPVRKPPPPVAHPGAGARPGGMPHRGPALPGPARPMPRQPGAL